MADTKIKIEDGDPQSVQDLTGFVPFHDLTIAFRFRIHISFLSSLFFIT